MGGGEKRLDSGHRVKSIQAFPIGGTWSGTSIA